MQTAALQCVRSLEVIEYVAPLRVFKQITSKSWLFTGSNPVSSKFSNKSGVNCNPPFNASTALIASRTSSIYFWVCSGFRAPTRVLSKPWATLLPRIGYLIFKRLHHPLLAINPSMPFALAISRAICFTDHHVNGKPRTQRLSICFIISSSRGSPRKLLGPVPRDFFFSWGVIVFL